MLQHLTGWTAWAESAPLPTQRLSHGHSRDRRGGETCKLNVTQWLTVWWSFKAIQAHASMSDLALTSLRVVTGHPFVTATAHGAGSTQRSRPFSKCLLDGSLRSHTFIRSAPFLADILTSWVLIWGCILYTGLQIFTLWQKSKVGVRIIFDGVLNSKFYGTTLVSYLQWMYFQWW